MLNNDLYIRSIAIKKPESNQYPFNLPLFRQLENLELRSKVVFLVGENSQFIIATHSPILLAFPNASIYVLSENAITLTPFEQTEHYVLTKQFLNNTGKFLKELLT